MAAESVTFDDEEAVAFYHSAHVAAAAVASQVDAARHVHPVGLPAVLYDELVVVS
jgi:TRAP-type uncharacterized transport system substrate-binding protein